jgi:DNA-binding transcriptional regulator YiaG
MREITRNPCRRDDSTVTRYAQDPIIRYRPVTPDEVRGARIGLVRRLIAVFEGRDLPIPVFAARLGKDKKAGYRWERGEDKPRGDTVDRIVEICIAAGLPMISAEWIERGRGGTAALGQILIPESALATEIQLPTVRSKRVTEADLDREEAAEQGAARKKGKRA